MKTNKQFYLFIAIAAVLTIAGYFFRNRYVGGITSGVSICLLIFVTVGRWQSKQALKQFDKVLKTRTKVRRITEEYSKR